MNLFHDSSFNVTSFSHKSLRKSIDLCQPDKVPLFIFQLSRYMILSINSGKNKFLKFQLSEVTFPHIKGEGPSTNIV